MRAGACRLLGHKVQKGWPVERLQFQVFTYERWTYVCGRCKRVLDIEWSSTDREDA